jgi:hypothetical protein
MSESKTVDSAAAALTHAIDNMVGQICPLAHRREMYGGIIFKKGGEHTQDAHLRPFRS